MKDRQFFSVAENRPTEGVKGSTSVPRPWSSKRTAVTWGTPTVSKHTTPSPANPDRASTVFQSLRTDCHHSRLRNVRRGSLHSLIDFPLSYIPEIELCRPTWCHRLITRA